MPRMVLGRDLERDTGLEISLLLTFKNYLYNNTKWTLFNYTKIMAYLMQRRVINIVDRDGSMWHVLIVPGIPVYTLATIKQPIIFSAGVVAVILQNRL